MRGESGLRVRCVSISERSDDEDAASSSGSASRLRWATGVESRVARLRDLDKLRFGVEGRLGGWGDREGGSEGGSGGGDNEA